MYEDENTREMIVDSVMDSSSQGEFISPEFGVQSLVWYVISLVYLASAWFQILPGSTLGRGGASE